MKKLDECEIGIEKVRGGCWWYLRNTEKHGLATLMMSGSTATASGARRNWQRFAKINGIEKWRWAE